MCVRQTILVFLWFFSFSFTCHAWSGKVIRIADGDTITVQCGVEEIKVRLYGIDCPEDDQAFGQDATDFLSSQVSDEIVDVEILDIDQYHRIVGIVSMKSLVINLDLIERGYAWFYPQYCKASACKAWLKAEAKAKAARRGLWKDSMPVAPWQYRKLSKQKKHEIALD